MNVITINKEVFDQIIKKIFLLSEQVNEMKNKYEDKGMGKYLNSSDVCRILHIGSRTLQTYRETGKIGFTQIGKKIYYRSVDINRFIERNKVQFQ